MANAYYSQYLFDTSVDTAPGIIRCDEEGNFLRITPFIPTMADVLLNAEDIVAIVQLAIPTLLDIDECNTLIDALTMSIEQQIAELKANDLATGKAVVTNDQ